MITKEKMQDLYEKAKEISRNTYSPYSAFPVGAAVLTSDGSTYLGTNVENASYGLTICAERVAICNAVTDGKKNITAIAVYAKNGDATPCGACRQFIAEFGSEIEVVYSHKGKLISQQISSLLPVSFSREELRL